MRIAVTGASGYLGSNFIDMYKGAYDITTIGRNLNVPSSCLGVNYIQSDYSRESLEGILKNTDAVIHLAYAMATKENEKRGIESYRSSMNATENILSVADNLGIKNIVFASSRLVYPSYSKTPFKEGDPVSPTTYYGKSKVMMEQLFEKYNSEGVASIKILRFGQIIGANMSVRGLFSVFMEKASKDEPLTLIGNDIRDYIYVKDACRAIAAAIVHPIAAGAFNISMGIGTDNRIMAESILGELDSHSEIIADSESKKDAGDRIVLDVTKAAESLGFRCQYDTISKIAKDILKKSDLKK